MIFDSVIGHDDIKKRLEKSIADAQVSHAYIFAGKRGVGKMTAALSFAEALTNGSKTDITVVTNEHYDTNSKSDAVSIKAIRAASADMYVKPYCADRRVFVVPNAEKLTIQAQNALLKVFEEPPSYCVIILVSQNDNMLLQTIRSRAVTMRFGNLSDAEVEDYFSKNDITISPAIIRLASGSIGMALELCKNDDTADILDEFVTMFKRIGQGDTADTYRLIDYFKKKKDNYEVLFDVMLIMLRDTMLNNKTDLSIDNISCGKCVRLIELVENTRNSFSFNANYDLAVSEMLLDILGAIND